jgi:hypothetical protein
MTAVDMSQSRDSSIRAFRRLIRPLILALLIAMPSPEKCGCASRKEWLIQQIEAI